MPQPIMVTLQKTKGEGSVSLTAASRKSQARFGGSPRKKEGQLTALPQPWGPGAVGSTAHPERGGRCSAESEVWGPHRKPGNSQKLRGRRLDQISHPGAGGDWADVPDAEEAEPDSVVGGWLLRMRGGRGQG